LKETQRLTKSFLEFAKRCPALLPMSFRCRIEHDVLNRAVLAEVRSKKEVAVAWTDWKPATLTCGGDL
jgi:hypothetical protein